MTDRVDTTLDRLDSAHSSAVGEDAPLTADEARHVASHLFVHGLLATRDEAAREASLSRALAALHNKPTISLAARRARAMVVQRVAAAIVFVAGLAVTIAVFTASGPDAEPPTATAAEVLADVEAALKQPSDRRYHVVVEALERPVRGAGTGPDNAPEWRTTGTGTLTSRAGEAFVCQMIVYPRPVLPLFPNRDGERPVREVPPRKTVFGSDGLTLWSIPTIGPALRLRLDNADGTQQGTDGDGAAPSAPWENDAEVGLGDEAQLARVLDKLDAHGYDVVIETREATLPDLPRLSESRNTWSLRGEPRDDAGYTRLVATPGTHTPDAVAQVLTRAELLVDEDEHRLVQVDLWLAPLVDKNKPERHISFRLLGHFDAEPTLYALESHLPLSRTVIDLPAR